MWPLQYNTGEVSLLPGEGIILCSDGMYTSADFSSIAVLLFNSPDMQHTLNTFSPNADDDASLVVLRRNTSIGNDIDMNTIMNDFGRFSSQMPLYAIIDKFVDEIENLFSSTPDLQSIATIVDFMKSHNLFPSKQRIEQLFNTAYACHSKLTDKAEIEISNTLCKDIKEMLVYVFTH